MFSLHDFIKSGLLEYVGREPRAWVEINAEGWTEKGVLTQDDLREIRAALEEHG